MKSIILLSGPVGAGKTTVARELIACSTGPMVYVEGDTFWAHIIRRSELLPRHKNFRMIMTAMVAAALPYALYGYETLLDFSIPPWFLEKADKLTSRREVPVDYVVLLPAEEICAARCAGRAEGIITDYGPYRDLYTDFSDIGRRHIIVNDQTDPAATAQLIRTGLEEGKFRLL
ncbi:MAG TPA: AAA family ATPase [Puia sp.]|nr:AAA family ATPase [Puia sp.]